MISISAVILAAGRSTRMGTQKLLMPWGASTVLGSVVQTLQHAGVAEIVIVTNSATAAQVADDRIHIALNDQGDMLASLQAGLQALKPSAQAALICLGDQPQMEEGSIRSVCAAFQKSGSRLVVPSYRMRRGHPWLAARAVWGEILAMQSGSMRAFLNDHAAHIEYVELNTPTILQDIDTPADYLKYKPPL